MSTRAAICEVQPSNGHLSLVRVLLVSIALHCVAITGIIFMLPKCHIDNCKLPRRIMQLVSFPVVLPQPPPPIVPQRAAKFSASKASTGPQVMPGAQPQPQVISAPETTPAESPTIVSKEVPPSKVLSETATNGTQGEKDDSIVEIGSVKALDNVDYSPLYNPKPVYPPVAIRAGIQGAVDVDLVINEFGRVEEFSIVKIDGHPDFGNETAKIIGKWRFPSPRINGKKTKIRFLYTVNFRLQ